MNQDQYEYMLGALARIDRKLDIALDAKASVPIADDEFEEEFDI